MKQEMKLVPTKFALAAAIIISASVFIITLMSTSQQFMRTAIIISSIYGGMGYAISIWGAIIGAIYSFIDTFILAWFFAWLYNKLL